MNEDAKSHARVEAIKSALMTSVAYWMLVDDCSPMEVLTAIGSVAERIFIVAPRMPSQQFSELLDQWLAAIRQDVLRERERERQREQGTTH